MGTTLIIEYLQEVLRKLDVLKQEKIADLTDQLAIVRACLKERNRSILIEQEITANCFIIRNGDVEYKIGDTIGKSKIVKFEAYGKELDVIGQGMTGVLTLDQPPIITKTLYPSIF